MNVLGVIDPGQNVSQEMSCPEQKSGDEHGADPSLGRKSLQNDQPWCRSRAKNRSDAVYAVT